DKGCSLERLLFHWQNKVISVEHGPIEGQHGSIEDEHGPIEGQHGIFATNQRKNLTELKKNSRI
ncbi:MAG: hypothetical protein WAM07_06955, partial [Halobacillus sp.]|uniref:hypothetical protein n=1 Tax=Halobacillus sp. TaxID=56800 RepID=UPI003BB0E6E4